MRGWEKMNIQKMVSKAIILLLLFSCFTSMFYIQESQATGSSIYVDVSNHAPGDGSANNPYRYIQQAINAANNGDTIYVFGGTYNETLLINKQLTIHGSIDKGNTIIEKRTTASPRYLIEITADYVTLENLNISDSANSIRVSLIYTKSDYLNLQLCNLTNSKIFVNTQHCMS